jgi:PTH2 family peptidyl-tRNA hydrolase
MGPGKIAAQCGHATLAAYKKAKKLNQKGLKYWAHHGQAKVVVKVTSEAEMYGNNCGLEKLLLVGLKPAINLSSLEFGYNTTRDAIKAAAEASGVLTSEIRDAGRTQVAAGSRTVLALGPAPIASIDAVAGHLKLY